MAIVLERGNSQVVTLPKLRSGKDSTPKNAATVTGTLIDPNGLEVEGLNSVQFQYVATTQGDYEAEFDLTDENVNPPAGNYDLFVKATQDGKQYSRHVKVKIVNPKE